MRVNVFYAFNINDVSYTASTTNKTPLKGTYYHSDWMVGIPDKVVYDLEGWWLNLHDRRTPVSGSGTQEHGQGVGFYKVNFQYINSFYFYRAGGSSGSPRKREFVTRGGTLTSHYWEVPSTNVSDTMLTVTLHKGNKKVSRRFRLISTYYNRNSPSWDFNNETGFVPLS